MLNTLRQKIVFSDYILMSLVIIIIALSGIFCAYNEFDFHYTTSLLFATSVQAMSWIDVTMLTIFGFILFFYGIGVRKLYPYSATLIWGIGAYFWVLLANILFANALQSTPFPPIDHTLVKIDQWMHINSAALMRWTHEHKYIHAVFMAVYNFLEYELVFLPMVLILFGARRRLTVFFIAQLSSFLIGGLIYYFWPTMAPSGIIHSPYFLPEQHDTSMRFYDVHHFIKINTTDGGLIAFPSFHVCWAILLTYTAYGKKIFFYPLCVINLILIASTVFLGWHYGVDVIGGAIIAALGIWLGERVTEARAN